MDVFFEVFDWAKARYSLSRTVKIDMEETSLKVYQDERLIVNAKGDTADIDAVYLDAAIKLDSWTRLQGG